MRDDEDRGIVQQGQLWSAFIATEFGREMFRFFDEQEAIAKDAAFQLLLQDDKDGAKQVAAKLSGILAVKSHIEDSIQQMKAVLEDEKNERAERRSIPRHV
jgi:hypothetical protein